MGRWRSLDFEPPSGDNTTRETTSATQEPPAQSATRRHGPLAGMVPPRHPKVAAARGLYLLRNWHGVVHTLSPAVLRDPAAVGGWLLLGLAQARLGEDTAANAAFQEALTASPNDPSTRTVYASFLLHHSRGTD